MPRFLLISFLAVLPFSPLPAEVDLQSVRTNPSGSLAVPYKPGIDFDSRSVNGDGPVRGLVPFASVQVRSQGTPGQISSLALDGGSPSHTAIALDGVPIRSAQNNVSDPGILPVDFISDADIVKNNLVPFGLPGTAGLVNFRTTPAGLDRNRLQMYMGSFLTYGGKIELSRAAGPVDFLLGASFVTASNNYSYVDSWDTTNTARNSDFTRYSFVGKLEWSGWHFGLSRTMRDGGAGPASLARQSDTLTIVSGNYSPDGWKADASYVGWENRYRDSAIGSDDIHDNKTIQTFLSADWTWGPYSLHPKLGNIFFHVDSTRVGVRSDDEIGLTLENFLDLGIAEFNLSAQQSYRPGLGYAIIPGGGVTVKPADFLRLIAEVSRHFRYPTFNDLYWPEDTFARGNPALYPEDGLCWKTGILVLLYPFRAGLSYSESVLNGLIQWLPGTDGKWSPANAGKTLTRTFQITGDLDFKSGSWGLAAGVSYSINADWNDDAASPYYGKRLVYSPLYKFSLNVTADYDRFAGIGLTVRQSSERYTTEANTTWLPAYWVLDARLSVAFLFIAVENALDANYQEIQGYPLPGRVFRGGIDWKF